MTIDEQIEILQAHKAGKKVRRLSKFGRSNTVTRVDHLFDFNNNEYEIVEETWRPATQDDYANGPVPARFTSIDVSWITGQLAGCTWRDGRFVWLDSDGIGWAKCEVMESDQ